MLCVEGVRLMKSFCENPGFPGSCGKVIVATDDSEVARLEELYRRGVANGVSGLELVGPTGCTKLSRTRAPSGRSSRRDCDRRFQQVAEAMAGG